MHTRYTFDPFVHYLRIKIYLILLLWHHSQFKALEKTFQHKNKRLNKKHLKIDKIEEWCNITWSKTIWKCLGLWTVVFGHVLYTKILILTRCNAQCRFCYISAVAWHLGTECHALNTKLQKCQWGLVFKFNVCMYKPCSTGQWDHFFLYVTSANPCNYVSHEHHLSSSVYLTVFQCLAIWLHVGCFTWCLFLLFHNLSERI